ncbi:putative phosphohistidine phosphatase, SixA [Roseibacterium elongatum DSM 19469]|uniref:Putative phosphohistidine phosphatase, SixA n=1 Tax=Roseicyclus elongatus DSM 19469 TaxID=1294273 RepID=W8S1F6_9RHOB|nr:histidine phosphatase family protein [Roseibacterium elongatum]AHM03982.1 putative phosphohistidine phosphatase, SixA [Roseibacterium elongatum DSM 19469]
MSRTLILIRHAKSDWGDAGLADHERPLNDRGRRSAPRIGHWLAEGGYHPDMAMVSSARRTQDTWDRIARELTDAPAPILSHGLYNAAPADLLTAIRSVEGVGTLAIVAHNPGIGSLAWSLCDSPPQHPKFGLYPTGATLVLRFRGKDWRDTAPGRGEVVAFVTPRDLPGRG